MENKTVRAKRTIRLCTKDCLCLYVCPTGASDTEDGQIDASRCIGCGKCAEACPSHAISMVPYEYPPQQKKTAGETAAMFALAKSKTQAEAAAVRVAGNAKTPCARQLAEAVGRSNRIMAEDILREAGYMLPQSGKAHRLLRSMLGNTDSDFPREAVEKLLEMIPQND